MKRNDNDVIQVRRLPPEARSKISLPPTAFLNYEEDKIKKGYIAIASLRFPHDQNYDDLLIENNFSYSGKPIKISIYNQSRISKIFIPSLPHYVLTYYPFNVEIDDVRQINIINNLVSNLELSEEALDSVSQLPVETDTDKGLNKVRTPIAPGPIKTNLSGCKDDKCAMSVIPTTRSVLQRDTTLISTKGKKQLSLEVKIKIINDVLEADTNLSRFEKEERTRVINRIKDSLIKHIEVLYFKGDELPKWTKGEIHIPMKPNHPKIIERSRPIAVAH